MKELHYIGDVLWFEYHCHESHTSCDAQIWYRSHQQITIVNGPLWDGLLWDGKRIENCDEFPLTKQLRANEALVLVYRVRWADGFEYDVFEDELLNEQNFERPDPPPSS
jgi:hypothetical protein